MICNASRRARRLLQRLMVPAEIVIAEVQGDSCFQALEMWENFLKGPSDNGSFLLCRSQQRTLRTLPKSTLQAASDVAAVAVILGLLG